MFTGKWTLGNFGFVEQVSFQVQINLNAVPAFVWSWNSTQGNLSWLVNNTILIKMYIFTFKNELVADLWGVIT